MAISALWLPGNSQADDRFAASRDRLVKLRIEAAGVKDSRVLQAIRSTPRHLFVPREDWGRAYYDMALPIGHGQTISSPFIVASMTEALEPDEEDKVLEIGTGSGYQAAVLSPLVKEVYSIEIVRELGESAAEVIKDLKLENVHTRVGDGFKGWPEAAPFDKIIVTCSPEKVPQPLIDQLVEGGMMIVPVGERYQQTMYRMIKKDGKLERQALRPTLFVPMTGAAEASRER
ncbi:MAG: protein-L-isoaspartate(D-aspartate) O-methyltransferase, partial [Planctomycetota bacterium]